METAQGSLRLAWTLSCLQNDELHGFFNQEGNDFQVNNGDAQETKWLTTGQDVTSQKIDELVSTINAAMNYAQDVAARYGELEKSSSITCTSLGKLESVLNTDSSDKIGHPANKLFGPQNDHESAMCKGIHKSVTSQTHYRIPNKKAKPSNDPIDISEEDNKTNLFTMNATMDYTQDVADRFDELQKSSHFICTSLAKSESALNTDALGMIWQPAKLFGPQNDHKSFMCKGIHKSIPSQTHDQVPNKKAKTSNDPNDICDEDDKINLFDNDSKGIKPLNDCVQSNSAQMMKCKIDTNDYSNKIEGPGNFYSVPKLTNVGIEQFQTPLACIKPHNDCLQSNSVQIMKRKIDTKDYSNRMAVCTRNYERVTPSKVGPSNLYSVPRLTYVGIEQFQTPLACIKPLNDSLQSNSMQIMKRKIDTKDYSNRMVICTRNYKRLIPSKGPDNCHSLPRNIPKLKSHTSLSYNDRYRGHNVTIEDPASNGKALSMYQFKSKFPLPPDMQLTPAESKVCAYVFHPDNHPSVLLRIGDTVATTRDIECLCPGRVIEDKIINFMALKTTWMQLDHITDQSIWSFPSSFANDVLLRGKPVNQLVKDYVIHLMPPFPSLKYIYLPIKDGGHWYLIVVSLEERIIHHLDSCFHVGQVRQRHSDIKTMCSTLAQMITSEYFPQEYLSSLLKINLWEIVDTKGISNCEESDNSAVWVLEWMRMEHCFQSNLVDVLNEKVVRMRTAMDLLLWSHNGYKESLEDKAESFWNKLKLQGAR